MLEFSVRRTAFYEPDRFAEFMNGQNDQEGLLGPTTLVSDDSRDRIWHIHQHGVTLKYTLTRETARLVFYGKEYNSPDSSIGIVERAIQAEARKLRLVKSEKREIA